MTKNEGRRDMHLRIAGRMRSNEKLVRRLSCRWCERKLSAT